MAKREFNLKRDLAPIKGYLSTGCTLMDLAITDKLTGGFPCGRISHIFGAESSCKTVLVMEALGSAQRQGGHAWFEDAEETFDGDRAEDVFDLDISEKKFTYEVPTTVEDLFDGAIAKAIVSQKRKKAPLSAMGVDSLTALGTIKEQETELGSDPYGGARPKMIGTAIRKYVSALASANLAFIVIDQTRDSLAMFGPQTTVSGGKGMKFYSCVRIELFSGEKILNENERIVGQVFKFKVIKNKVGVPFREGYFRLIFNYGIDDVATNLDWLHENNPLTSEDGESKLIKKPKKKVRKMVNARGRKPKDDDEKKTKKFDGYGWKDGVIATSLEDAAIAVEENNLEVALREEVYRVWGEIHKVAPRKEKVRFETSKKTKENVKDKSKRRNETDSN